MLDIEQVKYRSLPGTGVLGRTRHSGELTLRHDLETCDEEMVLDDLLRYPDREIEK